MPSIPGVLASGVGSLSQSPLTMLPTVHEGFFPLLEPSPSSVREKPDRETVCIETVFISLFDSFHLWEVLGPSSGWRIHTWWL